MDDEVLRIEHLADAVVTVTLNRPARRNALNRQLLTALQSAFGVITDEAAAGTVRAVVLTGTDPAFCAGLDLGEVAEAGLPSLDDHDPIESVVRCGVPVFGAINGPSATGGLELALACDVRIASDRASFADTHARVGVVPGWGLTARLPAAVGNSWARQMSSTGTWVDAATALRIGLVNEVVPHEQVVERAIALAREAADVDPEVLRVIRGLYDTGAAHGGAAARAGEREAWERRGTDVDPEALRARRDAVIARGRAR